ncbi:hypothetical protein DH09_12195 [Bacillaceae bacterium JMAK1]|nr:hypothetical protein DH09_12195 [Bacillaceae bacterium JMAK1]
MKSHDKVMDSAIKLVSNNPVDKLTFAMVAKEAEVHWTTVKRHFGSKEMMHETLRHKSKHLGTREQLLYAAEVVFKRLGYDKATLDDISAEAKMTKGAIYWHFNNKDHIFIELMDQVLNRLLQEIPMILANVFDQANPEEAIRVMLRVQFQSCIDDPPTLIYEFISRRREEHVRERLDHSFSKLFSGTAQVLRTLQQEGKLSEEVDVEHLSVTVHGLINGVVLMWLVAPHTVSLLDLADTVAATLTRVITSKNKGV